MRRWLIVLALTFAVSSATSAEALEDCDSLVFTKSSSDRLRPATVVGPPGVRALFHDGGKGCSSAACPRKAYLIPGDRFVVATVTDKWACAFYLGRKHAEIGWLDAAQLDIGQAERQPSIEAWYGHWTFGPNTINIKQGPTPDTLTVDGIALWIGHGLWDGDPAPNIGTINQSAKPKGNVVVVREDGCRVRATLVGEWLVSSDNGKCGGMNVYFDGVFRKTAPETPQ